MKNNGTHSTTRNMIIVIRDARPPLFLVICFLIHKYTGSMTTAKEAARINTVKKGKRIANVKNRTIAKSANKKYFSVLDVSILIV
jgi:hypothetical protein